MNALELLNERSRLIEAIRFAKTFAETIELTLAKVDIEFVLRQKYMIY